MSDEDVFSSELARPLVRQEADVRVTSKSGAWLRDVYLHEGSVFAVEMADGSLLQRIAGSAQFVLSRPVADSRFPTLSLVESVSFDSANGALEYVVVSSCGDKTAVRLQGDEG